MPPLRGGSLFVPSPVIVTATRPTPPMADLFLSHSSADDGFVRELREAVADLGQEVWIDSRQLMGGDPLWSAIQAAIEAAAGLAVLVSPKAFESDWVARELKHGLKVQAERGLAAFPVILLALDGTKPGSLAGYFDETPAYIPVSSAPGGATAAIHEILVALGLRLSTEATPQPQSAFLYDVALSFAGEDRDYVRAVAESLREREKRVFFDEFEKASLWGKDLYQHLNEVYESKSQVCVIFASVHYAQKRWTSHELRSAQARAFAENTEYLLPVRLDDTPIPGINETIGYLDGRETSPTELTELLIHKLDRG